MTSISQPHVGRTTGRTDSEAATGSAVDARVPTRYVWGALRLAVGFTFFWAFLDKLFGFGRATPANKGWLDGGSPTKGFLSASDGPFSGFYKAIAGDGWADALFMVGIAAIGLALLLGIGTRIAAISATVLYLMMWSVVLPPETNPFVDDHIIGALVVIGLALVAAGDTLGFGKWWRQLPIVRTNHWLI
jgi:thiosulfate dehydrogenase [quinone] large subunit